MDSLDSAAKSPLVKVPSPRSYGSTERVPLQNDVVTATAATTLTVPQIPRDIAPSQASVQAIMIPSSFSTVTVIPSMHRPSAFQPSMRSRLVLCITQTFSTIVSTIFLLCVVAWASLLHLYHHMPARFQPREHRQFEWDNPQLAKNEKVVKEVQVYAQAIGLDIIDEQVETADGFFLRVHRVVNPKHRLNQHGKGGYPVLILHGLFQSSGSFITSEERSLAFWLSEQGGYQVFLGNTRAVFNMGHRTLSRSDPRFWNWTMKDLAEYDFPALVDYVRDATGYDKIAFIGHSQGNGIAFISLSEGMHPAIGEKLSCFIALGPAVYAGHLTQGLLFRSLKRLEWTAWRRLFGVLDFLPIMQTSYKYAPPKLFATMGYIMFAYLFSWTDTNWLPRRKTKMFRFTPTPVSSASIFWWCGKGGFADRGCIMDDARQTWWIIQNPETGTTMCSLPPLSLWCGGKDYLIDAKKLIKRLEEHEVGVRILRIEEIEAAEHCDFYWAAESVEWCFIKILEDIEYTRSDRECAQIPN